MHATEKCWRMQIESSGV